LQGFAGISANSLQIAGGIGLLPEFAVGSDRPFDSGLFSLRFRIVRPTTAGKHRAIRISIFSQTTEKLPTAHDVVF
jgi:hypothetical protein